MILHSRHTRMRFENFRSKQTMSPCRARPSHSMLISSYVHLLLLDGQMNVFRNWRILNWTHRACVKSMMVTTNDAQLCEFESQIPTEESRHNEFSLFFFFFLFFWCVMLCKRKPPEKRTRARDCCDGERARASKRCASLSIRFSR